MTTDNTKPLVISDTPGYQAIVVAPGFCVGIRCDDDALSRIVFLPPGPEIAPQNKLADQVARQLAAYFANADATFELPLRPSGTPFQRRVWEQIAAIPTHQTRTYGEIAKILTNAPRAVGQACGANPFPVIVPCHRVLASGGGLGGFARHSGGLLLEVKRWLLTHERR